MRVLITAAVTVAGLVAFTVAGLVAFAAPTTAADQNVFAVGAGMDEYGSVVDHFEPASVRTLPGESVTWANRGGAHNVKFEDGQLEAPADPAPPEGWPTTPVRRTFARRGVYRFYCEMHGGPGGIGMAGTVLVGQTSSTPTPAPGSGAPPTSRDGVARIESLSMGRRFCNRRGRRCRRPGVRLVIKLSKPARVEGTLTRRPLRGGCRARTYGTLRFGAVGRARQLLRFTRTRSGRRLTPGRYALRIRAGVDSRLLRFTVVA